MKIHFIQNSRKRLIETSRKLCGILPKKNGKEVLVIGKQYKVMSDTRDIIGISKDTLTSEEWAGIKESITIGIEKHCHGLYTKCFVEIPCELQDCITYNASKLMTVAGRICYEGARKEAFSHPSVDRGRFEFNVYIQTKYVSRMILHGIVSFTDEWKCIEDVIESDAEKFRQKLTKMGSAFVGLLGVEIHCVFCTSDRHDFPKCSSDSSDSD